MSGEHGLSRTQSVVKRSFDIVAATAGIVLTSPVMAVSWLLASLDTRAGGLFRQVRVGKDGRPFRICKLRTMRHLDGVGTTVTTSRDPRITRLGGVLRKLKLDELPQLFNVLAGQMSFVGPRPDVPGYADRLTGADRIILTVRPGITGPAAIAYRHEEQLLAAADDPERYNREVIWPDKVRINREYVETYSFVSDIRCLIATLGSIFSFRRRPSTGARPVNDRLLHVSP